eukprot:scaffold795_cov375-Prasinococcus_capsulatus_cf.AAC.6
MTSQPRDWSRSGQYRQKFTRALRGTGPARGCNESGAEVAAAWGPRVCRQGHVAPRYSVHAYSRILCYMYVRVIGVPIDRS